MAYCTMVPLSSLGALYLHPSVTQTGTSPASPPPPLLFTPTPPPTPTTPAQIPPPPAQTPHHPSPDARVGMCARSVVPVRWRTAQWCSASTCAWLQHTQCSSGCQWQSAAAAAAAGESSGSSRKQLRSAHTFRGGVVGCRVAEHACLPCAVAAADAAPVAAV